jgi:hypothetical protein
MLSRIRNGCGPPALSKGSDGTKPRAIQNFKGIGFGSSLDLRLSYPHSRGLLGLVGGFGYCGADVESVSDGEFMKNPVAVVSAAVLIALVLSGCSGSPSISADNAQDYLLKSVDLPSSLDPADLEAFDGNGFNVDCAPGRRALRILRDSEGLGAVAFAQDEDSVEVTQDIYLLDSADELDELLSLVDEATSGECDVAFDGGSLEFTASQPLDQVVESDAQGVVWDESIEVGSVTLRTRTFLLVEGLSVSVLQYQAFGDDAESDANDIFEEMAAKPSE